MSQLFPLLIAVIGCRLWFGPISRKRISISISSLSKFPRKKTQLDDLQLISILGALRQELNAGNSVGYSLENVISYQVGDLFSTSKEAISNQENLLSALKADAELINNTAMHQLVNVLEINRATGSSIVNTIDMMINSALVRQEHKQQIAAELAGVKATITVLAFLPVVGIFLGLIMGVNIAYWLVTNPNGWVCFAISATLETLGVIWVKRLIKRAQ